MKIAIFSDVHGNLPALEAVVAHIDRWGPDLVLINGDTVNRGPRSAACWRLVRARGWLHVQGNHEEYVLQRAKTGPEADGRFHQLFYLSYWTRQQMQGDALALAGLPRLFTLAAPDGSSLRLCHASMHSNTDNVLADTPPPQLRRQIAPPPAVFATAHTHAGFVRPLGNTLIVNSGSVGCPLDGDTRASYAQVTWQRGIWQAQLVRVPYDRAQMDQDCQETGFLWRTGPVSWVIYHEWRLAQKLLPAWRQMYETAVLKGAIRLETAVSDFLSMHHLPYHSNGKTI